MGRVDPVGRAGRSIAHIAEEMGNSRNTAHKWVRRWRAEGDPGLHDRSSRPRATAHPRDTDP
ncbi:leucine zipper domain-containing protein [Streptomyces sp. RB6PN23]|uniref:Leucine zipper domain-containing protein n=1 Tax=Streptomyces silvisoli TaxID=3034235 RepID=A0ABT5ZDH0_9ACTN|nr:leucine zipper domain-containing protein [Streptomyces silvisoli]MDF3287884.1 leucine zipper domain-containing protein [Streptomyces silvisoli]